MSSVEVGIYERALVIAERAHRYQLRKYIEVPYIVHPISVAGIVRSYTTLRYGFPDLEACAAALLHDVLEDCPGWDRLRLEWEGIPSHIIDTVDELTDKIPKSAGNRAKRKKLEAERLSHCSPTAQTIKYADLMDNTSTIVKYDEGFAKVYLKEKRYLLEVMKKGDPTLREVAFAVLAEAERGL